MTDQRQRILFESLIAAIACAFIASALASGVSWLDNLENRARDLRIAAFQPAEPRSHSVAIVAIDEESIAQFPYRSPVDRKFLSEVLRQIDARGARAIGVDLIFDQPTEPEKDELLRQTLQSLGAPLAITFTRDPAIVNSRQLAYLERFVPAAQRSLATLGHDPIDGTVRSLPADAGGDNPEHMVRKLARAAGVAVSAQAIPIAWRGQASEGGAPFDIIPAHRVRELPADALRDKVVLVGLMLSLVDRHRTPFSVLDARDEVMMPAVLIHAHSLAQLLEQRPAPDPGPGVAIALALLMAGIGLALGLARIGFMPRIVLAALCLAVLWWLAIAGARFGLPVLPVVGPALTLFLTLWAVDLLQGRRERRRRRAIQGLFSRYVSPAVVEQLIARANTESVQAEQREASFVFTDIEGFTSLAERLPPARLATLLNDYLDGACQVVFRHGGTVDKFLGDGMMVIFNSPLAQKDHVERAVNCALALDDYAQSFRTRQAAQGIALGITRIGVHCGMAQIGSFGSRDRMEFTALGDAVNVAARVADANRITGTRLCCTAAVVERAPDPQFESLGEITLRGRQQTMVLYTHARAR